MQFVAVDFQQLVLLRHDFTNFLNFRLHLLYRLPPVETPALSVECLGTDERILIRTSNHLSIRSATQHHFCWRWCFENRQGLFSSLNEQVSRTSCSVEFPH